MNAVAQRRRYMRPCGVPNTLKIKHMNTINLDSIRKRLPSHATVRLTRYYNAPAIQCFVPPPYITERDFDAVKEAQKGIVGTENISEFFTEEIGHNWFIFLNRVQFEFEGLDDADVKAFTGGAVDPDNFV